MQTIATRIFIIASVLFGIVGLAIVFTSQPNQEPNVYLMKALFTCVFFILPSFALSVASKYLGNKE